MESFAEHFEALWHKQQKEQLDAQRQSFSAQEVLLQMVVDTLVKFNDKFDKIMEAVDPESRSRCSPFNTPERTPERTSLPPPVTHLEGLELSPVEPYQTPRPRQTETVHVPGPSAIPPLVREMPAFTSATDDIIPPVNDNQ
jgi:hypothetical protein